MTLSTPVAMAPKRKSRRRTKATALVRRPATGVRIKSEHAGDDNGFPATSADPDSKAR